MSVKQTVWALLAALDCLARLSHAQEAGRLTSSIAAMAQAQDDLGRRQVILSSLEAAGVQFHLEDFTFPKSAGTNIVANIPASNASRTLLLGAHYDRVALGQGAVDNAASCAVLLSLIRALKTSPLKNYSIVAVFFDLEEGGLIGSQAYFAKHANGERLPDEAVNLDIFGYGDTLFGFLSNDKGPLGQALQGAAQELNLHVRIASGGNYPASDHRIMARAGIDTLGLALIDGAEIDALEAKEPQPHIMSIIHTAKDTPEEIRISDVERGRAALEKMFRLLDESQTHRE